MFVCVYNVLSFSFLLYLFAHLFRPLCTAANNKKPSSSQTNLTVKTNFADAFDEINKLNL